MNPNLSRLCYDVSFPGSGSISMTRQCIGDYGTKDCPGTCTYYKQQQEKLRPKKLGGVELKVEGKS